MTEPLLEVKGLAKQFRVRSTTGAWRDLMAVDDVSFSVRPGEVVAIVGESGSGKSTTGLAALRLIEPTSGSVTFEGTDFLALSPRALRAARGSIQAIFQDPRGQLDPRVKIAETVAEPIRAQGVTDRQRIRTRVGEVLELVGLPTEFARRYPSQLSGGQRQRVGIARALAPEPKLILCDEAVSALDVSVQTQVLNVLRRLRADLGVSYMFISHGMAAVRYLADTVVVMYSGREVETSPAEEFFAGPAHPYSAALLSAVPSVDPGSGRERIVLRGEMPSPFVQRPGCVFADRCSQAQEVCRVNTPPRVTIGPGRTVSCFFPLQGAGGPTPVGHDS